MLLYQHQLLHQAFSPGGTDQAVAQYVVLLLYCQLTISTPRLATSVAPLYPQHSHQCIIFFSCSYHWHKIPENPYTEVDIIGGNDHR